MHQCGHKLGAGAAQGMTQGLRTAVDIKLVQIRPQRLGPLAGDQPDTARSGMDEHGNVLGELSARSVNSGVQIESGQKLTI